MTNPWFRMYHEFATDPKVQMLSESDQRRFVMLLCLRCSNGSETLHDEQVAFQLRISNEDWMATKEVLVSKKLIDGSNNPCAWNKRQYESDSSTTRVRRHRDKKKQECNVSVTPPDTDTDTDTEEENKKNKQKKFSAVSFLVGMGAERKLIDEWLIVRKKKNCTNTETAFEAFAREVEKSNRDVNEVLRQCVVASWSGFKASWPWESNAGHRPHAVQSQQQEARDWL